MKYKAWALLLALSLLLALAACGEAGGRSGAALSESSAEESEAFGAENVEGTPERMAETTMASGSGQTEPQMASEQEALTEEAPLPAGAVDLTGLAIKSAVCVEYLDGLAYDREEPVYFWRAVGYLVGLAGDQCPAAVVGDGFVTLTADELSGFVTALFGGYDTQYPSLGEENPLVASEYEDGTEIYRVTQWDLSAQSVAVTEPEAQGDGSYQVRAEIVEDDGTVAAYRVTLEDYPDSEGETALFAYSITAVEAE